MKTSYQLAVRLYSEAVQAGEQPDACHLCGAPVNEGVKGCFELFADLTILPQNDPAYGGATLYGVDAHALQHPELHGKKNNAAHLLRLCWVFDHGEEGAGNTVPRWWQSHLQRAEIALLPPPAFRGALTVADVARAETPQEHIDLMKAWAASVYAAWSQHHDWAKAELRSIFRGYR